MTDDVRELAGLQERARQLLARMSVLSDARGVSFIPSGAGGKHESTGTNGPGRRDGDQDLHSFWVQRFHDYWDNLPRMRSLVQVAQLDVDGRTNRKPVQSGEGPDGRESAWERDTRIIDWYQGIPADQAARIESRSGTFCPAANIRAVRRRQDCDPELGMPRVPREQRRAAARRLQAEGLSTRQIARELNVAQSTVMRALNASEESEAA